MTDSVSVTSLPERCKLRPATAKDIWRIRQLVFGAKLDPTQLRWSQFWVIEQDQQIIACGQLRDYADAQELGSLVVTAPWRGRGLGTQLSLHLMHLATKPLYLECLGERRTQFYQRLGFMPTSWHTLPPSLRPKFGLTHRLSTILRLPLQIMVYPHPSHSQ